MCGPGNNIKGRVNMRLQDIKIFGKESMT
jgi:hypothetical protein